jgi:multimeric flavodoxin WrbA
MKVVGFNGSPRKNGNTASLIRLVFDELGRKGIETELLQVGGTPLKGCTACMKCFENRDGCCALKGDILNECLAKMAEADGIILGSPTYFANVTSEMKALIDRAGMTAIANDHMLRRKVGAAVVAVRRAGSTQVFDSINRFFLINQMIVPGSNYWNTGIGLRQGDVLNDQEGVLTMQVLGENMAWVIGKLRVES